ncbi:Lrp/AsnC family transcriptional regulator [Azospirillum doebereinerae]
MAVTIKLDRHEKGILAALQDNARLTMQELGEAVGLSASPCWRRVRSMEEIGVIRRYTVHLDPRKLGLAECVFAHVTLERHKENAVDQFETAIAAMPEVLECFAVTGEADYLLRIVVPTTEDYGRFLSERIFSIPAVAHVKSSVTLKEVKFETRLPLTHLD